VPADPVGQLLASVHSAESLAQRYPWPAVVNPQCDSGVAMSNWVTSAVAFVASEREGRSFEAPHTYDTDGGNTVVLFTHPTSALSGAPQLLPDGIEALVNQLPEHTPLVIDPGNDVSVTISSTQRRDAIRTHRAGQSLATATSSTIPDRAASNAADAAPGAALRDDRRSDDDGVKRQPRTTADLSGLRRAGPAVRTSLTRRRRVGGKPALSRA